MLFSYGESTIRNIYTAMQKRLGAKIIITLLALSIVVGENLGLDIMDFSIGITGLSLYFLAIFEPEPDIKCRIKKITQSRHHQCVIAIFVLIMMNFWYSYLALLGLWVWYMLPILCDIKGKIDRREYDQPETIIWILVNIYISQCQWIFLRKAHIIEWSWKIVYFGLVLLALFCGLLIMLLGWAVFIKNQPFSQTAMDDDRDCSEEEAVNEGRANAIFDGNCFFVYICLFADAYVTETIYHQIVLVVLVSNVIELLIYVLFWKEIIAYIHYDFFSNCVWVNKGDICFVKRQSNKGRQLKYNFQNKFCSICQKQELEILHEVCGRLIGCSSCILRQVKKPHSWRFKCHSWRFKCHFCSSNRGTYLHLLPRSRLSQSLLYPSEYVFVPFDTN